MSVINLETAKSYLDVIHSADDVKLQLLLDGAEDEAMRFMNRDDLVEWDSDIDIDSEYLMPKSVVIGVLLMLQSNYQAGVDEIDKLRRAAETKLMPYRLQMGV